MPYTDVASTLINAFEAGRRDRLEREQLQQDQVDRDMRRDVLKHQLAQMKIEDKLKSWNTQREATLQNFNLLSGRVGEADIPADLAESALTIDPATGLPMLGPNVPAQGVETRLSSLRQFRPMTLAGVNIPEAGLTVPSIALRPETEEQSMAKVLASKMAEGRIEALTKPQKLGSGETLTLGGETIAEGGPRVRRFQSVNRMVNGKSVTLNFDPESGEYTDQAGRPVTGVRPIPPASLQGAGGGAGGSGLTSQALDNAAYQYAMTGQMPALGVGGIGLRTQIMNRAGELFSDLNLGENAAVYNANRASLANLQRMRNMIGSFEQTAQKNITVMEGVMKGLSDSGSPFLNQPWRAIELRGAGDKNVAAFAAARRVVVNEIAKITSNPNLAGQLSDEARSEADAILRGDYTIPQMMAAIGVLRQDMGNRLTSMDTEIADIRGRLRLSGGKTPGVGSQEPGPAAAEAPAAAPAPASSVGAGQVRQGKDGKWYRIQAVHPDGSVDATEVPGPKAVGPAAPGIGVVPADVQTLLRGKKAAKYTLSDGSVWIVNADGTITPGR